MNSEGKQVRGTNRLNSSCFTFTEKKIKKEKKEKHHLIASHAPKFHYRKIVTLKCIIS